METLTFILIAIAGLVWGSFLNVVIYRLPRKMSLIRPPSTCPGCGTRIKPYDNVPVLSYLWLGGKCRSCGRRISPVYPLVEALTALGFILVFCQSGRIAGLEFFAGCLFTSALISLGFIDYFHQVLPDAITMPGLVLALVYSFFRDDLTFRGALVGAASGAGFLLFVYGAYRLIRKKEGLGMGDVTMLLMVGAYLGLARTLLTLILGSFAGALVGVFLIVRRKKDLQFALPFGTFLAPAAFVAALWGERIVNAYLGLYRR
ncbi:MAG: prepilin peptidase [Candidatus Aminicenantales bacterium]|jgi:leader peptidase (prepilin peptidase)/N-methyltransferase